MKRILTAFLIAAGLHGFLFGIESSWLEKITIKIPDQRVLTMTLTAPQPQKPPLPLPSKNTKVKTKKKPILKPKIQKPVKGPSQPPEKDLPKAVSKKPVDRPLFPSDSKSFQIRKVPKKTTKEVAEKAPAAEIKAAVKQAVRLARPLYRINPSPKYPEIARRRGFEGNIVIEVLVGSNGIVLDLRISSSSGHPILDRAAVRSIKNWTFEPGMKGEENVEMWVKVPIRFELK